VGEKVGAVVVGVRVGAGDGARLGGAVVGARVGVGVGAVVNPITATE
jgi:hypothetical protein